MKWNLLKINDLVGSDEASLQTGPFGTQLKASEYVKEGIPVINVRNIEYGSVIDEKLEYVNNNTAERLKVHELRRNDIVFGRKGAVDRHALIDQKSIGWIQGSDCLRLRIRAENIHNKFVSYYFCTKAHKEWMEAQGSFGATMNSLNQDIIKRISIPLPPLTVQKKIAAVLSAYDDLLENNKRRIAILERMAEEIYREWFVRLRFPGYKKKKIVKGLPEGWETIKLNEIACESSKPSKPGIDLSHRYYLPLDLLESKQMLPIDHLDYTHANSSLVTFNKGEFLFGAMRPYQHKVAIAPFDGITRTTCFVIKPKEDYYYSYLFLLLFQKTTIEYATLICNGSDRPYAVWNRGFEKFPCIKPVDEVIEAFNNLVKPILDQIVAKYFLLRNIKTSRDLLLSRLLSGKLPVDELDIQFPKSMEDDYAELDQ